jgi:hypothetical protein
MEVINRDVHLGKCAEEARPARAMVEVAGMPRDAKVEISAITVAPYRTIRGCRRRACPGDGMAGTSPAMTIPWRVGRTLGRVVS